MLTKLLGGLSTYCIQASQLDTISHLILSFKQKIPFFNIIQTFEHHTSEILPTNICYIVLYSFRDIVIIL